MTNIVPLFRHVEIPHNAVTAARINLHQAVYELIRAGIHAEDHDTMLLGQDIAVMLNEADL